MIDTHCHCLFGVDDASKNIETSIAMIREAVEDGVTKILCTSHCLPGGKYPNDEKTLRKPFEIIEKEIEKQQIPIELYLGSEVFYMGDVLEWGQEARLVTLNNTDRILFEFPWRREDVAFEPIPAVKDMLNLGYRIIIAHPERYPCIHRDYRYMKELRDLGCNFQINRTSLVFKDDPCFNLAWRIVEDGYVDVIATDAHHAHSRRSIILSDSWDLIVKRYGEAEATRLMITNPQALIDGDDLVLRQKA
jgi:Capsular polysaccharide biosynthesis protein